MTLASVFRAAAAALLLAATSSCATVNPLTSQYVGPDEGKVFGYGNFCGPSFPRFSSRTDPGVREAELNALQPIDYVDGACRAHDICYEAFSHDNAFCDQMMGDILTFRARDSEFVDDSFDRVGYYPESSCDNLAREIVAGMQHKGEQRRYAAYQTARDGSYNAGTPVIGSLLWFGIDTIIRTPANALIGWPKAGICAAYLNTDKEVDLMRAVALSAELAFTAAVCNDFLAVYDVTNDVVSARYAADRRTAASRCKRLILPLIKGRIEPAMFLPLVDGASRMPANWQGVLAMRACIQSHLGAPNSQDWAALTRAAPQIDACLPARPPAPTDRRSQRRS